MPELMVGDVVRISNTGDCGHYFRDNSTGIIKYIKIPATGNMPYAVELLEGGIQGNHGHTCDGYTVAGQYVATQFLTFISRPSQETEETEETEETKDDDIEHCENCDEDAETCDCIQCSNCEQWDDNCDCIMCEHCSERFTEGQRYSCSECHACANCIRNGSADHYSCNGCNSCRSEDSRACDSCGEHECCVTFTCRSNDCYQCSNCCECAQGSESSEYIESYSCRDYPNAKPSPRTVPKTFLYLGVENETEATVDEDLHPIAEKIAKAHAHEILMKEDGSLEHGIELVTGRYSLDAHKELWPKLCETAIKAGLRSWKHSSTGLHVHMSRKFFSPLDIGKVLVFINSQESSIRSNIKRLAGRGENHYCTIQKKKLTDINKSADRHEAVNLTNDATIEIRIFKGTLNSDHVLADIEFCHAVANWVKETSTQDIESWCCFWSFVLKHKKTYQHLIAFLCPPKVQLTTGKVEDSESA